MRKSRRVGWIGNICVGNAKNDGGGYRNEGLEILKLSIENRPDLSSRAEFGHWKGDTVELVRGQSYLVTMV